jgi:cell wall-associated NlpC family hydrolase
VNRRKAIGLVIGLSAAAGAASAMPSVAQHLEVASARRRVQAEASPLFGTLYFERAAGPDRTIVYTRRGVPVATLTDGARTVLFNGPFRRWSEPRSTHAQVDTQAWVRLAPTAWHPGLQAEGAFQRWFTGALASAEPDVLAIAMEYLDAATAVRDGRGVRIAGDAAFGPEDGDDTRARGSDFYDYLQIAWRWPDKTTANPRPERAGCVDCSGFLRLVWGYRCGIPLYPGNDPVPGLPRRSYAIAAHAPAATVFDTGTRRPTRADLSRLQAGDVVFFALHADPASISHGGIYIGLDQYGHRRFVSSRMVANGPTIGDIHGESIVDGGYFGPRLRKAIRL